MAHFYLQETLRAADSRPGQVVTVDGAEARHAVTVSRVRPGDRLRLGNGAGLLLEGTVLSAEAMVLTLRVDDAIETAATTPRIRLVQALAKGDRDELAIQAATELGVDGVIPWSAARSITKWEGPKIAKGHERWSSIVREASKQSIRAWLPGVAPLASTKHLAGLAATTRMLLLDPFATGRLTEVAAPTDDRDILLVVGPEGGISPAELILLEQSGATPVRLGDTVLRTSTAGPAALAILNATLGRW
ncbi:MAG: 16S rRNA (uracil(1498)-N(3))-methyltransferase [Cryobacterium sp.]|uniref:16S rRNA (uracil(1498)-N(3))-methyltransferase n=1 Tax=unclassified Cryobacterium TaxID=2649013 RepID=UPI0018CA8CF6|nr:MULTISPECIES: 16S rRNA (uracil(1498)-N(3))-methyltransferase [unclassified Cryobacterium]MCY7404586.1 16S rRNA (uracil(1498)-N(3))-methyltransferase [Cryobacterium sp.]MEC5153883.1 16S rRNA (uracil1498-N3)-methyltransferase [Cryobacterium sp. CAN_C3]